MSNKKKKDGYTTEKRYAGVFTTDLKNGLVKLEIPIRDLEPTPIRHRPKGGKIFFDFLKSGYSFDMRTVMKDTINKKLTIYRLKVKQFPGRISIRDSKWHVEKGKIVVMMEKHEDSRNFDWDEILLTRGLDQGSSSSSSSSSTEDD